MPNRNDFDSFYAGSQDLVVGGNGTSLALVQPVYLFVDLEVAFQARGLPL